MSKKLVVSLLSFRVPCPEAGIPYVVFGTRAHYAASGEGVYRQIFCALSKAMLLSEGQEQQRSPGLWLRWQM